MGSGPEAKLKEVTMSLAVWWLIGALLLELIELATVDLTFLMLAIGALGASGATWAGAEPLMATPGHHSPDGAADRDPDFNGGRPGIFLSDGEKTLRIWRLKKRPRGRLFKG